MKLMSILLLAGGVVFLILTVALGLTGGSLDVTVLDVYFVVLPRYLMLVALAFLVGGFVFFWAHP
jgi:hypothetical protein